MAKYKVLIHEITYEKSQNYLTELKRDFTRCGTRLKSILIGRELRGIATEDFLDLLFQTKIPTLYAESQICGDGSDWNAPELSILGDMSIAVPVTVFDNGKHSFPEIHKEPFEATLIYVPGALLRNDSGQIPADRPEIIKDDNLHFEGYYSLYERRLFPAFMYINDKAKSSGQKALVTIPGLGCGQFAGEFRGQLGYEFKNVLLHFFTKYEHHFPNIALVYYDPYNECGNEDFKINENLFLVRPFLKGNQNKPQLCRPEAYLKNYILNEYEFFSVVAWDHVSWPGNDFYEGNRATDDGVKAAATNSMAVLTGIEGKYNPDKFMFEPPDCYKNWKDVIYKNKIKIQVKENLIVYKNIL
ncbi:MAG: hypothetical protein QMC67_05060 [Candidatus Wallbacteria bacterium]